MTSSYELERIRSRCTGQARIAVYDRAESMGLTWTTLNGEGGWPAVSVRYGFIGYSQYMLLDRDGRYITGNDEMELHITNLPQILDREFAAETDAATVH